jgi:hypothetical protein
VERPERKNRETDGRAREECNKTEGMLFINFKVGNNFFVVVQVAGRYSALLALQH